MMIFERVYPTIMRKNVGLEMFWLELGQAKLFLYNLKMWDIPRRTGSLNARLYYIATLWGTPQPIVSLVLLAFSLLRILDNSVGMCLMSAAYLTTLFPIVNQQNV